MSCCGKHTTQVSFKITDSYIMIIHAYDKDKDFINKLVYSQVDRQRFEKELVVHFSSCGREPSHINTQKGILRVKNRKS